LKKKIIKGGKDMKKRRLAISVLSLIMAMIMLLCGCGGGGAGSSQVGGQGNVQENVKPDAAGQAQETGLPRYKIGVVLYTLSNQWAKNIMRALDYLGEEFNCEMFYVEASSPDVYISTFENLCASGVNGILTLHTGTMTQQLMSICEKNKVYLSISTNDVSVDQGFEEFSKSEYFCGYIYENDYEIGYDIAKDMLAKGAKTFALHSLPMGIAAQMDDRFNGAYDAIIEGGGKVLGEGRSFAKGEAAQNLLSQFPDVDAIFSTVAAVESVLQPVAVAGRTGDLLLNTFDATDGTLEALQDNAIQYAVEGFNVDSMFAFVLLYNSLRGTPLKPADGSAPAMKMNYVVAKSAQEYEDVTKYLFGDIPAYTSDELKQYMKVFNPDATFEAAKAELESFTLESAKNRHKDIVK
jgi:ABC-type sugar transport system substrate-binding protein